MKSTKLLLIRHGETEDNHRRVFQGQGGRGLSARGRAQTERLAARLVEGCVRIDALYCSDLERARETAQILAGALGLGAPVEDRDLREVDVGAWQGLDLDEIARRFPDEQKAWLDGHDFKRGGGESYAELGVRVTRSIERIAAEHAGKTVAIVSHGASLKVFVAGVLGIGMDRLRFIRVATNTAVSLVERTGDGRTTLVLWNDASHLDDPLREALSPPPS